MDNFVTKVIFSNGIKVDFILIMISFKKALHPEIRQKFDALWVNLVAFETFICNRDPTDEECERAAEVCENWCRIYPVVFPTKGLTRKMTEYSLVFPWFIRGKKGIMNKMFRLEQEEEHIHQLLNTLERVFKPLSVNHFHMLEAYENKVYCTK